MLATTDCTNWVKSSPATAMAINFVLNAVQEAFVRSDDADLQRRIAACDPELKAV